MTRHMFATMTAVAALTLAGCGKKDESTTVQTTTVNETGMTADMAAPASAGEV